MGVRSALAAVGVFGAAVAVSAAGFVAADSGPTASGPDRAGEVREFISQQLLTCQRWQPAAGRSGWATAVSVPGLPGVAGPGVLRLGQVGGGRQGAQTDVPGATVEVGGGGRLATAAVTAEGGLAPGLTAAALSWDLRGEGKGIASSPCRQSGSDMWLVGGGAGEGQRDLVVLSNPTSTDAVAGIAAYGKGGEVAGPGAADVAVPAGSTEVVRLDVLAPGVADAVVRVRTKVGILDATVVDDRMDGLTPRGTDVIIPAGRPRERLTIAPLPPGAGTRRLVLLAPDGRATVRVTAVTAEGTEELLAGEEVRAKGGRVVALDLTEALRGRAAALRIEATAPVVAGASAATDPDGEAAAAAAAEVAAAEQAIKDARGAAERTEAEAQLAKAETRNAIPPGEDLAWFGPVEPLQGSAAVTGLRSEFTVDLLVTAVAGDATAKVSLLPGGDRAAELRDFAEVEVPHGQTRVVRLEPPRGAAVFTAVLTPADGSGPLVAGHQQRGPEGAITGYGLQSLPAWIGMPRSEPDYSSG